MQDGAPANQAIAVRQSLQQLFPNHIVALGDGTE
jgi:hypothetical protein